MTVKIARILLLAAGLALAACSTTEQPAEPSSPKDTADSRVSQGMTNLDRGDYLQAEKAFKRALELKPGYIPAHAGLVEVGIAAERYDAARIALENARESNPTAAQRRRLAALEIQLLKAERPEDWYATARDAFEAAASNVRGAGQDPQLLHAIANASLAAVRAGTTPERLEAARGYANRLTATDSPLSADGQNILSELDRIRRARLQSDPKVSELAAKDAITRRDLALLLNRILVLPDYLDGVAFKQAQPGETDDEGRSDYAHLAAARAIRYCHRAPLRSLEIDDGRFYPTRQVSRESFAMVLQDLIRARTGRSDMAQDHFGSSSPFRDVAPTRVSFSAIMTAVSRDLMATRENGAFAPTAPVSGSVAIEALRQLHQIERGMA